MYGMSDDEIARIREGRFDGFPPAEVALLRMADAVSDTPSKVSDELYAELRQHFTEDELIELAAAAAQENFRARYNRVFDVGSDGLYRKGLRLKQRQVA
jgi:alkylhydroperoxidase family enzyme